MKTWHLGLLAVLVGVVACGSSMPTSPNPEDAFAGTCPSNLLGTFHSANFSSAPGWSSGDWTFAIWTNFHFLGELTALGDSIWYGYKCDWVVLDIGPATVTDSILSARKAIAYWVTIKDSAVEAGDGRKVVP